MKNNLTMLFSKIKGSFTTKGVVIFVSVQLMAIIAAFILFGIIPVGNEVSKITKQFNPEGVSENKLPQEKVALLERVRDREHYESVLKSALLLSKTDSISLLIDLKDSLAILSLKGVSLFQSKISEIEFNQGLKKLPVYLRDSLYSGPFPVKKELASIEKFPVVIKKAPKDTTEASADDAAPILPIQNDVFVLFLLDNNLVIEINQQEHDLAGSKRAYRNFKANYSRFFRDHNFALIKDKNAPSYLYRLKIFIPREEARSIYRALPIKPYVLVRY
ncbi:MAG: hypothetical protein A2X19_01475 [Bacteroidetes bacterium GWE2_39_28]|nr:MAG: hypothetical protein A2X19_01475 [Bacteroidetes bacterium GWE2_39_28]OFY15796.1 MAG: hypothetical protein A2X16_01745 [Bacteroidetes bacterium GWF2_39_10]OFZ06881.1 MAG: hypothetical protein A2322_01540 [Bacteroidetes bacterium RIFOXYB2_FULL_39_7]OFZ09964.1 MAG: hypothetical protein A2465_06685 [Bacteroidetes bacterium RIFOXYC2_FULL_39_11]HCT93507.1 hypothetical protein [Rikenellaceae bacterium]